MFDISKIKPKIHPRSGRRPNIFAVSELLPKIAFRSCISMLHSQFSQISHCFIILICHAIHVICISYSIASLARVSCYDVIGRCTDDATMVNPILSYNTQSCHIRQHRYKVSYVIEVIVLISLFWKWSMIIWCCNGQRCYYGDGRSLFRHCFYGHAMHE